MQEGPDALDLKQVLGVVRRRGPLVVLCIVIAAAAAFGFSKHEAKKYTATASLAFNTNPIGQQIAGLPSAGVSSSDLSAQQASNVALVKGGGTAARIAGLLGQGLTAEKVFDSVTVSGQGESDVVAISATADSPLLAAKIANTYASEFVNEQQRVSREYFRSALALVRKQLAALSPAQRVGPDGLELQDRAQTLGLLSGLKEGNVQIASEALASASASSPKTSKNTALGAFLGLLVGIGLSLVLERLDRRLERREDLERIYRLPLLGTIPGSPALAKRAKHPTRAVLPPAESEAFGLVRAHLRFFNPDHDTRTLLIASPDTGEGKTTIARNLAESAARLGSRVLLLEVDLRHPTLAQQLSIQPGPGLTDVLIGSIPMDEATSAVELEPRPGERAEGRKLDVLAAGGVLPPNPTELLESRAMAAVLERARSSYDLVIIDPPPLAVVPDALPLLQKVDGVVVVGRIGRSRGDAAAQLQQVLASSDAVALGLIVNGARSDGPRVSGLAANDKSSMNGATSNGTASAADLVSSAQA